LPLDIAKIAQVAQKGRHRVREPVLRSGYQIA